MDKESVVLLAEFDQRGLVPRVLKLAGREYRIEKVNLMHSITDGLVRIYFFSVSDKTNYWKLGFNTESLKWWVEDSYSG
jgi:hypothetical protein